ncbi:general odorant-binding protein 56h [Calliphora vicina]|uniref:general odorant-binding protein 56h n=1 Tax=Calliphora vicina TaxID=7373 RepID=UPI00325A777F
MKFYILFIALVMAVVQVKSDMKEELRKVEMACRQESQVTEADWDSLFKGGWKEEPKENFKCHMKCVMEKHGQWKNGAFDENAAKKYLQDIPALKDHQEIIDQTMADCKTKKGGNDCDTAYLITKCFFEHKPDNM